MDDRTQRRDEEAHDILAADEFGIGGRDARYADPSGIHEPHDVLAAEEFAMPAGGVTRGSPSGPGPRALLPLALVALAALLVLRRRG